MDDNTWHLITGVLLILLGMSLLVVFGMRTATFDVIPECFYTTDGNAAGVDCPACDRFIVAPIQGIHLGVCTKLIAGECPHCGVRLRYVASVDDNGDVNITAIVPESEVYHA